MKADRERKSGVRILTVVEREETRMEGIEEKMIKRIKKKKRDQD
jgi:hypothetical protein